MVITIMVNYNDHGYDDHGYNDHGYNDHSYNEFTVVTNYIIYCIDIFGPNWVLFVQHKVSRLWWYPGQMLTVS